MGLIKRRGWLAVVVVRLSRDPKYVEAGRYMEFWWARAREVYHLTGFCHMTCV